MANVLEFNHAPDGIGTLKHYVAGSYITGDALKPYHGAFVLNSNSASAKIKIPVIKPLGTGRTFDHATDAIEKDKWIMSLTATDGIQRNELFGFGMNPEASIMNDVFDEPALPAPEGMNTFDVSLRKNARHSIVRDIVPSLPNYSWSGNANWQ